MSFGAYTFMMLRVMLLYHLKKMKMIHLSIRVCIFTFSAFRISLFITKTMPVEFVELSSLRELMTDILL